MNKHWAISFGVLTAVVIGIIVATAVDQWPEEQEVVHYHAGFQVYIDNQLQDFSDLKYMNLVPCGEQDEADTPEEEQMEKAHLHDLNGDVVHSHREGAVWGDVFTNMGYALTTDQPRQVYVDGQLLEGDILTKPIVPYGSIVIFVGSNDDIPEKLEGAVTEDRIREVESLSESCGGKE